MFFRCFFVLSLKFIVCLQLFLLLLLQNLLIQREGFLKQSKCTRRQSRRSRFCFFIKTESHKDASTSSVWLTWLGRTNGLSDLRRKCWKRFRRVARIFRATPSNFLFMLWISPTFRECLMQAQKHLWKFVPSTTYYTMYIFTYILCTLYILYFL